VKTQFKKGFIRVLAAKKGLPLNLELKKVLFAARKDLPLNLELKKVSFVN